MKLNTFSLLLGFIMLIIIEVHYKEIQIIIYSLLLGTILITWKYCTSLKFKINIFIFICLAVHFLTKSNNKLIVEKEVVLNVKVSKKINTKLNSLIYKGKIQNSVTNFGNHSVVIYLYNKKLILEKEKIYKLKGILSNDHQGQLKIRSAVIIKNHDNFYGKIKKRILRKIDCQFLEISKNQEIYGFLNAIILGNKEFLVPENKSLYQKSGTMHLFAVSGIHVGFAYIIIKLIFGIFLKNKKIINLIVFFILFLYLDIVNYPPSAQRATIMICFFLISKLLYRKTNLLSNIYLTAILVLLFDENYLFELGFQLSFTVVTAIVIISKNLNYNFNNWVTTYFYRALLTSYSAFIGSTILVADAFSIIVPGAIIINAIVIPICFIFLIVILSIFGISIIFQLILFKEIICQFKIILDSIIGILSIQSFSYFEINSKGNFPGFIHLVYPLTFFMYRFYYKKKFVSIFLVILILPLLLLFLI